MLWYNMGSGTTRYHLLIRLQTVQQVALEGLQGSHTASLDGKIRSWRFLCKASTCIAR